MRFASRRSVRWPARHFARRRMPVRLSRASVGIAALACGAAAIAGLQSSYLVPLDNDAIQYDKAPVSDPVSRLKARLDAGETQLKFEDEYGYLRSVLEELNVSTDS